MWKKTSGLAAFTIAFVASVLFAGTPRPLIDMTIPVPNNKGINLKSYRGKVLLVAVISTDCGPCAASIEILNRVQKDFAAQPFQVVAAAGDPNAQYLLEPFRQRYRPIFPLGYLSTDDIIRLGGFTKDDRPFVPIFLFVDRNGVVRQQLSGDSAFFKSEEASTRKVIQDMLKQ
jgi:thiol-disulfide isomerase/thioredoxin